MRTLFASPGSRDVRHGCPAYLSRLLCFAAVLTLAVGLAACGGGSSSTTTADPGGGGGGGGGFDEVDPVLLESIFGAWGGSGHNDVTAEAFTHWDEDGEVSQGCARCHSTPGFQDYIGDDGTAAESTESAHPTGTTVNCDACHNPTALELDHVVFPSGAIATDLGAEARCMTCHQGRHSTVSLNSHILAATVVDDDTPASGLSFQNIHYFAAGATLYGGAAQGAYQYTLPGPDGIVGNTDDEPLYEGHFYDRRNPHVAKADTCIECHDPHTLERQIDLCATCHTNGPGGAPVASDAELRNIRMAGSVADYDGDGSTIEGIYYEIDTMVTTLYAALQAYAVANPATMAIGYESHSYPYFFNDTDGSGVIEAGEANYGNRYNTWTARLLRAAYNYQYAQKDPGAFAHNPKYTIEFLYDSLADLDAYAPGLVPTLAAMHRNDGGHFDAGADAFRHWDRAADDIEPGSIDLGDVSSSCARCHSPGGFDFWAEYGIDITTSQPVGDGFRCEQCHVEGADFAGVPAVKEVAAVEFPSGEEITNPGGDTSFVCMSCHKGRESGVQVDERIAGGTPAFRNVHYLPAGATLYGSEAKVGYQYPAKIYAAKWGHFGGVSAECKFCHLTDHSFKPQVADTCKVCHGDIALETFRINRPVDYDGDLDVTEPLKDELTTLGDALLLTMQAYATLNLPIGIVYDSHAYPYWFKDTNGNGISDGPAEANYGNQYRDWDAALSKAAFNYQYWQKEPGAWAHNTDYMAQLLFDSLEDLDPLAVLGFNRP